MKIITNTQLSQISGGLASLSGGFGMGPDGMTFQPGFSITVTHDSANVMRNFAVYADCVIDLASNQVLFDGTQSSFCFNGSTFTVSSVEGGHRYTYTGYC